MDVEGEIDTRQVMVLKMFINYSQVYGDTMKFVVECVQILR
jgi:hypothetical protein